MANFGRFVCVLVPFLLTLASLIALLVAGLAGVTDKSLYMFQVNTTGLSLSPLSVSKILGVPGVPRAADVEVKAPSLDSRQSGSQTTNITAADLGLDDLYDVGIWAYCSTAHNGTRNCTKPAFNWAEHALNVTTGNLHSLITSTGLNVTLPKEITDAVNAFSTVSKWTQIVFVIAYVALGIELFFGLFANFSRAFSCITWLIALVAAVAVGAAAGLATATSVVVVGAVEGSAKHYGVEAHFNTRFLLTVWVATAFAIGAALFWIFTVCCCAPDRSARRSRHADKTEMLVSGAGGYQRLSGPHGHNGYGQQYPRHEPQQTYGAPHHGGAYEPYSHARV